MPLALEKMEKAESLALSVGKEDKYDEEVVRKTKMSLENNLCYYTTEMWDTLPSDANVRIIHKYKQQAEEHYEQLKTVLENNPHLATSNSYDTLAWHSYVRYAKQANDQDIEFLKLAKSYITRASQYPNYSPSMLTSASIQREHIQIILSKCAVFGI